MTSKDTQILMVSPLVLFQLNSKPRMCITEQLFKNIKFSEVKLHIKAYPPFKPLNNNYVPSKKLYLFDKIRIHNNRGVKIFEHNLPEVIELDDNYSVKISDIFHDDMVVEGLTIYFERNDRPFEITEFYFEYLETDEQPQSVPFYKNFEKTHNLQNDNSGQKYWLNMTENHNMTTKIPEFKIQRIVKENDIYYISNQSYENDIEWVLIDEKEKINENVKKIEDYVGHQIFIKIKPTSNVVFLTEGKYFR